jgi:hypothetical protein
MRLFLVTPHLAWGRLKGLRPFKTLLPLSPIYRGEGDKGDEVDKQPQ